MATDSLAHRRRLAWVVLGLFGIAAVVVLMFNLRRPPQMGPDEEVFKTVDALFTAVTARDEKLLRACAGRLNAHAEAGKLPQTSADYLDAIIAKARAGGWESAGRKLYDFMRAQQREGYDSKKRPKNAFAPSLRPSQLASTPETLSHESPILLA